MKNLFTNSSNIPAKGSETFETLLENREFKIEKILSNAFENGEWYEQESDEWVVLLRGSAVLEFEDFSQELACGDYLFIPKLQKHRVLKTSHDAMWLAVHSNAL